MDSEGLATVRDFYEEHARALFTYALAFTGCRAAAEDAVHEAVCRILRRPSAPEELKPYAFRCVRNAAIDAHRRRRPSEPLGILDLEAAADVGLDRILHAHLERELLALPRDEMEAVVLHLFDDAVTVRARCPADASGSTSWPHDGERGRGRVPCRRSPLGIQRSTPRMGQNTQAHNDRGACCRARSPDARRTTEDR